MNTVFSTCHAFSCYSFLAGKQTKSFTRAHNLRRAIQRYLTLDVDTCTPSNFGFLVNLRFRFDEELFFFSGPGITSGQFQTLHCSSVQNPLALRSTLALVKQCRGHSLLSYSKRIIFFILFLSVPPFSSMSPFWLQASHSRRQHQSIFGQPYSSCRLSTCQ
jgi:hypothetical protein